MPIQYRIDQSDMLVRLELSDPLDLEQVQEAVHRLVSDPALRPGLNFISDHSKLDFTATTDFVRAIRTPLIDLVERLGPFRCAIVVPSDASYGMARMAESLTEDIHAEVLAFRSLEEAESWSKAAPRHNTGQAPRQKAAP
jgi:hypothetical protein